MMAEKAEGQPTRGQKSRYLNNRERAGVDEGMDGIPPASPSRVLFEPFNFDTQGGRGGSRHLMYVLEKANLAGAKSQTDGGKRSTSTFIQG